MFGRSSPASYLPGIPPPPQAAMFVSKGSRHNSSPKLSVDWSAHNRCTIYGTKKDERERQGPPDCGINMTPPQPPT